LRSLVVASALLAIGACYSPDLEDCVVRCATDDECGGEQVCGRGGFCAAPELADTCQAPMQPMPQNVVLRVVVDGRGRVMLGSSRVCGKLDADHDECSWQVTKSVAHALVATPAPSFQFDRWTTANCMDSGSTCTLTLGSASAVGVRFRFSNDDDDKGDVP
jgi:hypothetical protein